MDKSDPPTSVHCSSSRREKQPPPRSPPPYRSKSESVQASCDVASAAPRPPVAPRGGGSQFAPAGRARGNRRSAAASVLESTEVTPILDLFRTGNNAEIRAAINNAFSVSDDDVEAVVVGVDNSDGNSDDLFDVVNGHSYFGDHLNLNPEDSSEIEGPRPLTSSPIANRNGRPSLSRGWCKVHVDEALTRWPAIPSGYGDDDNDNALLCLSIELSTTYERLPVGERHDDAIPTDAATTTMRRQRRRRRAIQRTMTMIVTS